MLTNENDPAYLNIIKNNFDNYKIITIVRNSSDLLFANMKRTGSLKTQKNSIKICLLKKYKSYKND